MERENKFDYKGSSVFYRIYGDGQPVMLVHGFGETGDVWANQVAYLKDKFLLIVPDLPGSGQSGMIEDMSMEGMSDVLKAILETESPTFPPSLRGTKQTGVKTALIGHSMGGYITLAFAEKYSSLLNCFGLFHSTAFPDTDEKKATRRKGIEFMKEHGAFEFLKTAVPNLFSPATKQDSPQLVNDFLQSLSGFSPDALIAYYEAMIRRPDRTEVLKQAGVPVLFIAGESDNAVPMQDILKQTHLPERADINILHGSGHMGMLEEKDKTNLILEKFLTESLR